MRKMAKAAWYPKAVKMDYGTTGGTMIGGMPHATLHTTETLNWAGQANYHIQFREGAPGIVEVRQYRPFNKAARGLRNAVGGVQTNRQGSVHIQPCIVGYAKDAPSNGAFTDAMYRALNEFALWAEAEWGIPMQADLPSGGAECYGINSACRMSSAQWKAYRGWSGHQNAPENTHWDAGNFDWTRMMTLDGTAPQEDTDMFTIKGATGAVVEYWQRRILRIDPSALPQFGADGDYGNEMQDAIVALVPGSDGLQVGPMEAETLDALVVADVDMDLYLTKHWASQRYATQAYVNSTFVKKGTTIQVEL
jgi:hypothetical protein